MPAPYQNPYDTPEWADTQPPAGPRKQTREEMVLGGDYQDPTRREALGSGIAQLQSLLGGAYNPRMASALNIGLRNGRSLAEIIGMFRDQAGGDPYGAFSQSHDGGTAIQNLLSQFGPVRPPQGGPGVPVPPRGGGNPLGLTPVGGDPVPHYAPNGGYNVPVGGGRGITAAGGDPVPHYNPNRGFGQGGAPIVTTAGPGGTYGGGQPYTPPPQIDPPGRVPDPKGGTPPVGGGGGVGPGGQPIGGGPRKIGGVDGGYNNMQSQQPQPQTITMRYDYRQPNQQQSSRPQGQSQQQGQSAPNYNRASGQTNQWNQQQQFAAQRPFEQTAPNRTSPTQEANKANQGYQGWRGNGQGAASRY